MVLLVLVMMIVMKVVLVVGQMVGTMPFMVVLTVAAIIEVTARYHKWRFMVVLVVGRDAHRRRHYCFSCH